MSRYGYILQQIHFEYDDNHYTSTEGSSSLHIYTVEADAERDCLQRERQEWRSTRLGDYAYDGIDSLTSLYSGDDAVELANEIKDIFSVSTADEDGAKLKTKRKAELQANLSKMLNGKALDEAINETLSEEFEEDEKFEEGDEDEALDYILDFEVPVLASDAQIDALRALIDNISFYTVEQVEID